MAKRGRPDLVTSVMFLTIIVKAPAYDDYDKLGKVVKYLRGTPKLCLTLEGNTPLRAIWRADGSHAVHLDMKRHTGDYWPLIKAPCPHLLRDKK